MDLYWFIPALVNRRVGSDKGTTDDDGTARQHSLTTVVAPQERRGQKHTKRVALLLEIIEKSVSNLDGRPFDLPILLRSHSEG
jgi:hypothetical protein